MKKCNVCGKEIADNARFCRWCGSPVLDDQKIEHQENVSSEAKKNEPPSSVIEPVKIRSTTDKQSFTQTNGKGCPTCGAQIYNWDSYCGKCGNRLTPTEQRPHKEKKKISKKAIIAGVSVIAVVIGWFAIKGIIKKVQVSNSHYIARFQDDTGKWGYMDEHGNVIVDCRYDEAQDFNSDGYALVGARQTEYMYSDNVHYGVIDTKGNEVVLCQNTYVNLDSLDEYGSCSIERYDDIYEIYYDGIANIDGTTMINHEYNIRSNIGDSKLFVACYSNTEDMMYGVMDESYNWVLEPDYSWLDVLRDENSNPIKINGEYCLIASINDNDATGLIDINGNILLPFDYYYIQNNSNVNMIQVRDRSEHYGVIDSSLESVWDCSFDEMSNFSINGKAVAKQGSTAYLIGADGEYIELGYGISGNCYQSTLFQIYVEDEEKYGVIDENGSWILQPEYDYVSIYKQYITANNYDDNEGYVFDLTGKMISSGYNSYEAYGDIQNAIPVYNGSYYGAVDQNGNDIVECNYDYVETRDGWVNLYDVENPRGVLINPEGEVISNEYTRYFVSSDGEYITAWTENNWNDYSSNIMVQSIILDSNGSVKKQAIDDRYSIGALMKVR